MTSSKAKTLRKGSTKTFSEQNPHGLPSDRPVKVIDYDDERVVFGWETQTEDGQDIVRTASCTREEWEKE